MNEAVATLDLDFFDLRRKNEELRELNENLARMAKLKKENGIFFYRPHWKQHVFHTTTKVGRFLRTGNRFGKSECGIAEDIAWLMGGRKWYEQEFDVLDGDRKVCYHHPGGPDHPFVRAGIPSHPVKGLLIVVDWDKAKEVFTNETDDPKTCGKLWKFLPKNSVVSVQKSRGGHIEMIQVQRPKEYGGGISTLKIDTIESWKHNKLGGESGDFDFIHVDEPCPEEMFNSYARGLMDRAGKHWFTCTPLDQMWINDRFVPEGKWDGQIEQGLEFGSKFIIQGSTYDNPHRTDAGVQEFESSLTSEERECRIKGLPLAMAGLVYKEFVFDMHVLADVPKGWKDYNDPPLDYTIRIWWDVHISKPQALLYFATAPDGTVFVYDEQYYSKYIHDNAELLKEKIVRRNVMAMEMDPSAFVDNPVDDTNIADTLMGYDLCFQPATKDRTRGTIMVAEKLKERGHNNLPTIFFSPNCKRTLWEIQRYIYDLDTGKPIDKNDHMMENLYRAILSGLEYVQVDDGAYVVRDFDRVVSHRESLVL